MNHRTMSEKQGYTLVELLVAIAIIAALAAILFPIFSTARASARKTTCLSNLHQIGSAIALYTQDYDNYMPYAPDTFRKVLVSSGIGKDGSKLNDVALIQPDIKSILTPYGTTDLIFKCPSDALTLPLPLLNGQTHLPATHYAYSGSSYYYNDWNALLPTSMDYFDQPAAAYLMGDFACFHDSSEDGEGYYNVLHIDLHVKSLTREQTGHTISVTER